MIWDPFEEIERMHEEINKMWARQLGNRGLADSRELTPYGKFRMPLARMQENEKTVVARFELPGVDKENINLNVLDNMIELKVQQKHENETKKKDIYSYENSVQQFFRRIQLPAGVDPERVRADYKNGVLTVEMPKTKRFGHDVKRIPIK